MTVIWDMNESDIRDLLVHQLDCLETGLQYLDKEQYIPSHITTRSFIDIVARDADNHFVIIELKRSDSAARQAIHEVLKYVEATKAYLGVRDDEIRTMIVSTQWAELLLPFSRFCSDTSLAVTGLLLDISDPANLSTESVRPLKITAGRNFSPWHELNLYSDQDNLQLGVQSYERVNALKGLDDYVLVVLKPPPGHHETELSVTRDALVDVQRQFGEVDYDGIRATLEKMPEFKYMLYFVPCLLSREACIEALRRTDEDTDDLLEYVEQMDEMEALCQLHESLFGASPTPYREHFEIGYPAKFKTKLIEVVGWTIIEIKRYGSIDRNPLLTDATIVSEIHGDTGSSGQHYQRRISTAVKSELSMAQSEIAECLANNPAWAANVLAHLQEVDDLLPNGEVDINIFNPSTGLFTLYLAATQDRGERYVPSYCITVEKGGDATTIFIGQLDVRDTQTTLREVIDRFYQGNIGNLALSMTWGGQERRDTELLDVLGIEYRSYRWDITGNARRLLVWRNSTWREIDPVIPLRSLTTFVEREQTFMHHLVTKLGRRIKHGFVDGSDTDLPLRELAQISTLDGQRYEAAALRSHCELCGCAFAEENFLVEAVVPDRGGVSASLCADCVADTGATVGTHQSKLYKRFDRETWQRLTADPPGASST